MPAIAETLNTVQSVAESGYKWGFETDIEMDFAPKGLNTDIVRLISARKGEPEWLLEWRLRAYSAWLGMVEPDWALLNYPKIDYQDSYYYAAPKKKAGPASLDEVDPELLKMYEKLGIPGQRARHPGWRGGCGRAVADGGGRGVRQRLRSHNLPRHAGEIRRDLLPDQRGGEGSP